MSCGSIQCRTCGCVDHSPGQHACTVGSDQYRCIRRILDSRGNPQKVGLRDLRHRLVLRNVQLAGQKIHRVLNAPAVGVGQRSKAHDPDAKGADLEGQISGEILDSAKCRANRGRAQDMRPSRATGHKNDRSGVLLNHMARGGAGSDKARLYHRRSGTMNSSIGNSTAFFPFPYSLARGPAASRTISILPVCFTTPSMYWLTAAASRISVTAACAPPPLAVICFATASTVDLVRPDMKTSAPSAANSLATAEPIEPPAPKTTAYFPFSIGVLFM